MSNHKWRFEPCPNPANAEFMVNHLLRFGENVGSIMLDKDDDFADLLRDANVGAAAPPSVMGLLPADSVKLEHYRAED